MALEGDITSGSTGLEHIVHFTLACPHSPLLEAPTGLDAGFVERCASDNRQDVLAKGSTIDHLPDRIAGCGLPRDLRCTCEMGFAAAASEAPLAPSCCAPSFPKAMLAR
eukprot:3450693-Alexandrium_andersonii.AAC.1